MTENAIAITTMSPPTTRAESIIERKYHCKLFNYYTYYSL